MNVAELTAEARRLSGLLDKGVDALRDTARQLADAEHAYRLARAQAYTTSPEGLTVDERKAHVDGVTADLRRERDYQDAFRQAALEAVRSRRTQTSLLQSVAAAARSEAEIGRYSPEMTP